MFEQLGITDESLKAWDSITAFGQLKDTKVQKGEPLFPRLEAEEEIAYIKGKMQGSAPAKEETKKKSLKRSIVYLKLRLINLWM